VRHARALAIALALALAACGEPTAQPPASNAAREALLPAAGRAAGDARTAASPAPTPITDTLPAAEPATPTRDAEAGADAASAPASTAATPTAAFVPRAAAPGAALSPVHVRQIGSATIRFWVVHAERIGRDRFEYQIQASVQNGGGALLRGALMLSSGAPTTDVVDSCATFGTTPPGTTRETDGPLVIAQDRGDAFDPNALGFAIDATPDPTLCEDPGRVTLRRLNRTEYDHTVRDLLGTARTPAIDFPADDFGYGFDTIGDVLALSPLLFEKAEAAARTLVDEALRVYPPESTTRVQGESGEAECGAINSNAWLLWSACALSLDVTVPVPSTYEIRVRAWAAQAGSEPARMQLRVGAVAIGAETDVPATSTSPGIYTFQTSLEPGTWPLFVEFTNDYYEPPDDRNLWIDWVEIRGPLEIPPTPPEVAALRGLCDPGVDGRVPCTRERIAWFARKAWRRPPASAEIDALVALADDAWADGASADAALGVALRAVLVSPHFLFRVERDPHPRSAEAHPLSDHELATRLSYLIWASMPDEELDALADAGQLSAPATLAAQVHRMAQDPKARGFVESYAGQWLGTRALDDVNPDSARFPSWDEELEEAMRQETHLFLLELLRSDGDFLALFDAPFTYLNDRLAAHYGLPLPGSTTPVRVALGAQGQRGGIFTHGSVLTATSQPRRTSVVKRGKWALDQLLCIDIAPPPAGVEGMLDDPGATGTLRERLAAHRAQPECAACHDYLDPIGLGLEHYDAVGAWRDTDEGQPVDATGSFPDGRSFDGAREMAALVKADPNTPRCLAERLLIYALGRGLGAADEAHLDAVTARFEAGGRSFEDLLVAIVQSDPFRMRRGEPSTEASP
jgi:hypothetical protein